MASKSGKGKQPFGGKQAAPFAKGGGRRTNSPRDSKGRPKRRGKPTSAS